MKYAEAIEALQNEDRDIRQYAVQCLGKIGNPLAIQPLLELLDDNEHSIRNYLVKSLAKFGATAVPDLIEILNQHPAKPDSRVVETAISALVAIGEPAQEALKSRNSDDNPSIRMTAISVMDSSAGTPFLFALKDEDYRVRQAAVKRMGNIGGKWTVAPLLNTLLNDPQQQVCQSACTALKSVADEQIIPELIDALKNGNSAQHMIGEVLGELGPSVIDPLAALYAEYNGLRKTIIQVLGKRKNINREKAFNVVLHGLKDEDPNIRYVAINTFSNHRGPEVVQPSIEAMKDESRMVRRQAVSVLRWYGDQRAIDVLIQALEDSELAYGAACGLGNIGGDRAKAALLKMLQHEDSGTRRIAAEGLGNLHDKQVEKALLKALQDNNSSVRNTALNSLQKCGTKDAIDLILDRALHDDDQLVQRNAIRALERVGDQRVIEPLMALADNENQSIRIAVAKVFGMYGDVRIKDYLLRMLSDETSDVVSSAMWGLARICGAVAAEPIIHVLQTHVSGYVRRKAVSALGDLGNARAVNALIEALDNPDDYVPNVAAEALGRIADARATQALIKVLSHEDWHVRYAACWALGEIGEKKVAKTIIRLIKDAEPQVRDCAVQTLGRLGVGEKALIKALKDDKWFSQYRLPHMLKMPNQAESPIWSLFIDLNIGIGSYGVGRVCDSAAGALRQFNTPTARAALEKWEQNQLPQMIAVLEYPRWEMQQTAAKVLGAIGNKRAVEPLLKHLKHENVKVRCAVAEALGQIGDPLAVSSLIPLLKDRGETMMMKVCDSAVTALQQIGTPQALAAVKAWEKEQ